MKNILPPVLTPREIRDNLAAMAQSIEETTYSKPLTPEEVDAKKDKLTENIIKNSELELKKKSFLAEIKLQQKPMAEENAGLLTAIRTRQQIVSGILYHIDDQESGMMNSYDESGELVSSRRLRPDEKHPTIFNIQKAQ